MKLGISSYTFGWAIGVDGHRPPDAPTALDLIDRATALNVRLLQIADNLPPATYEPASVAAIAAHAQAQGVALELGTRSCQPEHLTRFIAIAQQLHSPILRVVLDTADDHPSEAETLTRLASVAPLAADTGVTIAIENHDRFKSATLARIAQTLWPHVGICLDTVNSFGALEGPEVVVDTLGPYVVNLHLKDFAIRRVPYLQGFLVEGRPAGQGMLNVPWVLEKLQTFKRDCNAIAELWVPPEATPAETIAKEAAWAAQSVQTLRQYIKH